MDFKVISGVEGPLATFRVAPRQAVELSAALVTGPDDFPTSGGQHMEGPMIISDNKNA